MYIHLIIDDRLQPPNTKTQIDQKKINIWVKYVSQQNEPNRESAIEREMVFN